MNFQVKFYTILIILSMILFGYEGGYVSIGFTLVIFAVGISYIKNKKILFNKWLFFFAFYCFSIQFFYNHLLVGDTITGLSIVLMYLGIVVLANFISEEYIYRVLKVFGVISILGIFYHFIMIYFFNTPVSSITLGGGNLIGYEDRVHMRPVSFFSEPQAFSSFIMPFLFLAIKRKDLFWAIIITFSIVLSTSIQGMCISSILWFVFLLKHKIYQQIISFSILITVYFFFSLTQSFSFTENKISSFDITSDVRITRGFLIYNTMSAKKKAFGVGFGMDNVKNYAQSKDDILEWSYGNDRAGYTSGVSGLLVQFGYVGCALYFLLLFKLYTNSQKENKIFIILILASSFSQNLLFNSWFFYFFVFYFGIENDFYRKARHIDNLKRKKKIINA